MEERAVALGTDGPSARAGGESAPKEADGAVNMARQSYASDLILLFNLV